MGRLTISLLAASALAACGQSRDEAGNGSVNNGIVNAAAATASVWPGTLKTVGDGFPKAGDPCRVIGETAATVDYLDDSATLAGCPTAEQAVALGGKVLTSVDGITLVSIPRAAKAVSGEGDSQGDGKVAGTDYNATADIPCSGIKGGGPTCKAGVTRGADQIAIDVTIKGGRRTLLFDGRGQFITHSSSQADGSAALQSKSKREGDWQVITVGPETYRIPDAFVLGD